MNSDKSDIGKFGEDAAADFLRKNGYKIVGRNVRVSKNEIDIIAEDRNYIVFVEVKTRSCLYPESGNYGSPGRAVTSKKRIFTVNAAKAYLSKNYTEKQPRIDVIEVFVKERDPQKNIYPCVLNVNHIRNAFDAMARYEHLLKLKEMYK